MAKFIPNAIMLYRPGETLIDGKWVDFKVFDRDSPDFAKDSKGWTAIEAVAIAKNVSPGGDK